MHPTRLVAGALAAAVLGACGAAPAAPWTAPATITADVGVYHRPALTFTGDGHALASLDGSGESGPTEVLAAEPGASTFTQIGRATLLAGPAAYGRRGVAYLRTPAPPPGPRSLHELKETRLGVSLGTAGSLGRWAPLARIAVGPEGVSAAVAADPRGNVAAAWFAPRGNRTMLRVALRRPGRAFDRAMTLADVSTWEGDSLSVAYGANGDLVVAFERSRSKLVDYPLEFAVRVKRSGRGFGPVDSLGPSRGRSSIATAVAPDGAAVVAWGTRDGGEALGEDEGEEAPWRVRAATLRAGADRFSDSQLLDPGRGVYPVSGVHAAIGAGTPATVAWSSVSRQHSVRVATADPRGRFVTEQLAPNGSALGVVIAPDGAATVLWGSLIDPEAQSLERIFASRRPAAGSRFAAAQPVPPGARPTTNDGAIALDPRSGRPAALWIGARSGPCFLLGDDCSVDATYSLGARATGSRHRRSSG